LARPLAVLLLGAFGIACAAIFVRLALPAPPIVTGFWRLALATGALAALLAPRLRWRALDRRCVGAALAAGACFGADLALWNTALVETSVATATLLVNTTPVCVGLFSVLVWRERLGARLLAGGALALLGVALLLGDDLDAASAVAISGVASTLVLAAAALWRGDPFTGFPLHAWAVFVASALVSHLAGVVGIVWALAHLRATFAAIALLAQPVGTALLAWWWLDEALTPLEALGGVAVLGGIALASRGRGEAAAGA
jgi:drug/metabolite transporter (DMT)-like permease